MFGTKKSKQRRRSLHSRYIKKKYCKNIENRKAHPYICGGAESLSLPGNDCFFHELLQAELPHTQRGTERRVWPDAMTNLQLICYSEHVIRIRLSIFARDSGQLSAN